MLTGSIDMVKLFLIVLSIGYLTGCAPAHTKIGFNFNVNDERRKEARDLSSSTYQGGIRKNKQVAIILISGGYHAIEMYDETETVISEFYYWRKYDLAYRYDEDNAKRYMAREGYTVSLDFYLQHRNQGFTPDEIYTMRRLGFKKTPAILIMDLSGNTLESFQGYDVPEGEGLHWLVCKYTSIVNEGLCKE